MMNSNRCCLVASVGSIPTSINSIGGQYHTHIDQGNASGDGCSPVWKVASERVRAHILLGCLTPGEKADNGTRKHASRGIDNAPCVYGIPGPAGAIRYTPGSLYHTFWGYAEK